MESLFIQLSDFNPKIDPYGWFCDPGSHIVTCSVHNILKIWLSVLRYFSLYIYVILFLAIKPYSDSDSIRILG